MSVEARCDRRHAVEQRPHPCLAGAQLQGVPAQPVGGKPAVVRGPPAEDVLAPDAVAQTQRQFAVAAGEEITRPALGEVAGDEVGSRHAISVTEDQVVGPRHLDAAVHRRALAIPLVGLPEMPQIEGDLGPQRLDAGAGFGAGAIIDNDHLEVGEGLARIAEQNPFEPLRLVVGGYQNADGGHGHALPRETSTSYLRGNGSSALRPHFGSKTAGPSIVAKRSKPYKLFTSFFEPRT